MRNIKLVTGEYYHLYNRGVEKRSIFLDHPDYRRFLISLEELNQEGPVPNFRRMIKLEPAQTKDTSCALVDIVCYCLMPNHFHLILRQAAEKGISSYMHKIGTSYTNYFNKRYDRDGVLFQGAYKIKHIPSNAYLLHLSRYIHLNPLEIISNTESGVDWRTLEKYPWSSLARYIYRDRRSIIGLKNDIIMKQFETGEQYRAFLKSLEDSHLPKGLGIDEFDQSRALIIGV